MAILIPRGSAERAASHFAQLHLGSGESGPDPGGGGVQVVAAVARRAGWKGRCCRAACSGMLGAGIAIGPARRDGCGISRLGEDRRAFGGVLAGRPGDAAAGRTVLTSRACRDGRSHRRLRGLWRGPSSGGADRAQTGRPRRASTPTADGFALAAILVLVTVVNLASREVHQQEFWADYWQKQREVVADIDALWAERYRRTPR